MIHSLKPGQTIEDFFLLRKKELRNRKDGEEIYLHLELGDAHGRISASCWQHAEEYYRQLQEGEPVKVRGQVIDYKGRHHLSVEKIRPVKEDDVFDRESLTAKAPQAAEEYYADIVAFVASIENPPLQKLLHDIFADEDIRERFLNAAGGKLWHHDYIGGLAQHTCQVARICSQLSKLYPQLQYDLLIAGALLHDIGKVFEYENKGVIDFTTEGRLLGHIAMGFHFVARRIDAQTQFPQNLRQALLHLILSHQGTHEQGSPVLPMTREAMLLYFADQIDAQLNALDKIYQRDTQPGKQWSSYVKLLDRYFFLGDHPDKKGE